MQPSSRIENLKTLKAANIDAAFATAFATMVSGAFLVGLTKYLGGGDYEIGLLTAVPALFGVLQIPGAAWGRSFRSFKMFIAPGGLVWRMMYIPLIGIAIVPWPNSLRIAVLLFCITLASAASQLIGATYNEWLGELVPPNSRGWYFSRRTLICTVAGMIVGPAGGFILDKFRDGGHEQFGYTTLFSLGVVFAIISIVFYYKMTDTPREVVVPFRLKQTWQMVVTPLQDKNFRVILLFTAVFMASQGFAGNLFAAYALESLHMPFTLLQMTTISNALGMIAALKIWGFLSDKYGNKPILVIGMLGVILTPGMWILCRPNELVLNSTILIVGHFFNGIIWSSVAVSQLNLYMATAKGDDRANYLATAQTVQALAGGLAPLLGAAMMSSLRHSLGDAMIAYKWVFATVMGIRVIAFFTLLPVREEGAVSVRATLRELVQISPRGVVALRAMRAGAHERTREDAIASVGEAGLGLATSEVAAALHDPSPRVRRSAAQALGKIGTTEAAGHLLQVLKDNPDLVEEEMIEALSDAPTPDAIPLLEKYLDHPRSVLRRAAARALGAVGNEAAIAPLARAASQPGDTDLRRASIQALRTMGAKNVGRTYADALFDPQGSVRTAAAEAISELELSEYAEDLRRSLEWFGDQDPTEVAYALGVVGEASDLPILLKIAQDAVSKTARRRVLLGAARILGVETEAYRLMTMDEIDRDNALISQIRPAAKRSPGLAEALERYSLGDEAGALKLLAQDWPDSALASLADQPVEDAFLLGALAVAKQAGH